jgi:hypothetical protein
MNPHAVVVLCWLIVTVPTLIVLALVGLSVDFVALIFGLCVAALVLALVIVKSG